ncbi:MAG TPA: type 1 glutamine amidotransferase domain-containing protein [Alteraurantiacibacter sp.]
MKAGRHFLKVASPLAAAAAIAMAVPAPAGAGEAKRKILIVASNAVDAGDVDKTDARNNLWEIAPPYHVFAMNGYEVDFVSPEGGKLPFSRDVDETDPPGMISYTIRFEGFREKADNSLTPGEVDPDRYAAFFIGGGFGPLFDVARDPELLALMGRIYDSGGVAGACGHGPGGLANVELPDGANMVAGKRVTGFPNSSELESRWSRQGSLLPFLVEDALRARGGLFQTKDDLPDKHDIVIDERLVTTMFLPSCAIAAKEMVDILEARPAVPVQGH